MAWKLGMTMTSKDVLLFNPLKVKETEIIKFIKENSFHIYLICKRKKLYFESCDTSGLEENVSLFYTLDEKHNKQFVKLPHSKDIVITDHKAGKIMNTFQGEAFENDDYLAMNRLFCPEYPSFPNPSNCYMDAIPTDLEVVYIGQSFGRTKKKHIDKRLTNHEKIQEVSNRIISEGTSEEVLIVGLNYKVATPGILTVRQGTAKPDVSFKKMVELRKKAKKRMRESQEITLYEAGLISYFRPYLNTEYTKHKFPDLGYSSYEEIFNLDFDYSTAEINTLPLLVRLYSAHVPSRQHGHLNKFALNTNDQKKDFFQFLFE